MDASNATQGLTEALQQGLGFTPDDLANNEQGKLNERQKTALVTRLGQGGAEPGQGCRLVMVLIPLLVLVLLVGAFFVVAGDTARALLNAVAGLASQPYAPIFAIPIIILVVAVLNSMRLQSRWRNYFRRIRESPDSANIVSREGKARRFTMMGGRRGTTSRYVVIGSTSLQVFDIQQCDAFRDGVVYRVYYVELGPIPYFLSARVIDNA